MNYVLIYLFGCLNGLLFLYIWKRHHTVGVLKIYDDMEDGASYIFMELDEGFREFRENSVVSLRVENASYYENQK